MSSKSEQLTLDRDQLSAFVIASAFLRGYTIDQLVEGCREELRPQAVTAIMDGSLCNDNFWAIQNGLATKLRVQWRNVLQEASRGIASQHRVIQLAAEYCIQSARTSAQMYAFMTHIQKQFVVPFTSSSDRFAAAARSRVEVPQTLRDMASEFYSWSLRKTDS
jgi:hypothetical protein